MNLFWEKGYEATSLSDLTQTLEIGKGSFYDTFGSKRKLFDQCLLNYRTNSLLVLDSILGEKDDPIEALEYLLEKHTEMMLDDIGARGCFIANSTTELSNDNGVQAFLQEHNQIMRAKLGGVLARTKHAQNADAITDLILNHLTGISVMSKLVKDSKRFKASNEVFMKFLNG